MARVAVAFAVVIALAAGVWILWPDDESGSTTTQPVAATSTTDIRPTTAPSTTTTTEADHIVDTVEEAEEILRDFWMGWFGGIYDRNPAKVREVVLTEDQVAAASQQFDIMEFNEQPSPQALQFEDTEILLSTTDCLSVWATVRATFRDGSSSGVHVLRMHEGSWKLVNFWVNREDLWEEDCSVVLP